MASQLELGDVSSSSETSREPSLNKLDKFEKLEKQQQLLDRFEPLSDARTAVDLESGAATMTANTPNAPPGTADGDGNGSDACCSPEPPTAPSVVADPERMSIAQVAVQQLQRIPTYLQPDMPIRDRLNHFTFAWYTLTMSTSGIALVLGLTPHRFRGLDVIGLVIFLLDLIFFIFICVAMGFRFALHRHTLGRACTHPSESLFISTFFLSVCALLCNVAEYSRLFLAEGSAARVGLGRFLVVTYWIYLGVTFVQAVVQYHLLFTVKKSLRLDVSSMTPAWILPIFPAMLAGTLAAFVAPDASPADALGMVLSGLAAQGLGFFVSVFMYATYLSRLMAYGLPVQRPGMFIAVGPPSFTCAAFIALAADVPRLLADADTRTLLLADVGLSYATAAQAESVATNIIANLRMTALVSAVFLWGLSMWFFASAGAAVIGGMPDRRFHLSWWSFVFPNAGLTIATIRLGDGLGSEGVLWLASAMTICLFVAWLFIGVRCVQAVIRREIVWPGHDEDS